MIRSRGAPMNDRTLDVVVPGTPTGRRARLVLPWGSIATVVFVHGGVTAGRTSLRDRFVADRMNALGLATLQADLVGRDEMVGVPPVDEVAVLAERLRSVTGFVAEHPLTASRPIAHFGAGLGSAAALCAVADHRGPVSSLVCRGGPVELAAKRLTDVDVPTLFLVSAGELSERARLLLAAMRCERRVEVVAGATDLFDDEVSLSSVATSASRWILSHLP